MGKREREKKSVKIKRIKRNEREENVKGKIAEEKREWRKMNGKD